jgi:5-formyltetrahydrofolate cyclo-ligase
MSDPLAKQDVRERVWRALEIHGAARFPGAKGRIPNFPGAEAAALHVSALPEWKRARVVKANPDAPQLALRRMALREGKLLYMAVPRLGDDRPFVALDPARLGAAGPKAATIKGAAVYGEGVTLDEMQPIDLIICGSVAVNGRGMRLGKGGGYSDLEYGMLRERGLVGEETCILTTVHPLQIVPYELPSLPHDITLTCIITPGGPLRCVSGRPRPVGIYWDCLDEARIASIPVLVELKRARDAR